MQAVWAVQMDLLKELIRVCEKYNITYYGDSGTLLGAIRHKGYIPWDDDIDVVMTRSEYNRLLEVAEKEFTHPYFFQTRETDYGYERPFARLQGHGIRLWRGKLYRGDRRASLGAEIRRVYEYYFVRNDGRRQEYRRRVACRPCQNGVLGYGRDY